MLGNQAFAVFSGRGIFANKLQYKLTGIDFIDLFHIKKYFSNSPCASSSGFLRESFFVKEKR